MRLRYKRAFELSANFLVMMILSIAMLGFGIYFAKQLFTKSTDLTVEIDQQTDERIEQLLNDGSRVVLPFVTKTIYRGKTGVFGIGVLYVNNDPTDPNAMANFMAYAQRPILPGVPYYFAASGVDKNGAEFTDPNDLLKVELVYSTDVVPLGNLQSHKFAILVDVNNDAKSGTYVIDLVVEKYPLPGGPWAAYADPLYKLYVVVP